MSFDFVHGKNLASAMLTDDGTPTGLVNANGDYSVTPKSFFIQPPENTVFEIHTINFEMVTTNSTFNAEGYGSGIVLPNGIIMFIENNGDITNLLPVGAVIDDNSVWSRLSSPERVNIVVPNGNNPVHYMLRIVLPEMYRDPIFLNGSSNDKFGFILQDDFNGRVTVQNWFVTGRIRLDIDKGSSV